MTTKSKRYPLKENTIYSFETQFEMIPLREYYEFVFQLKKTFSSLFIFCDFTKNPGSLSTNHYSGGNRMQIELTNSWETFSQSS